MPDMTPMTPMRRISPMATYGNSIGRPSFLLDFFNTPSVNAPRGGAPSVNTRATIATVTDWEGVTREVLSGENRFGGMRRVRNLLVGTENVASWSVNTGVTKSNLSDGVTQFVYDGSGSAGAFRFFQAIITSEVGQSYRGAVDLKATAPIQMLLTKNIGGFATINLTTDWQRFDANGATAGDGATALQLAVYSVGGNNSTFTIQMRKPMVERVTGQANQNPSEYVSVGVLSSPFQGANVDGVQYYATQNGNTVASNVVTEATGAALNSTLNQGYWMYLPGVSGNYASTPDTAAVSITGDIDIRVQVALADWTPATDQALLAKYAGAGNRSYRLYVNAAGAVISLQYSTDGTTLITDSSTIAPTVSDGTTIWVRATLDVDNGASGRTTTFYTSNDGSTWTQLGAVVTTAGTFTIFDSTSLLECGGANYGTVAFSSGRFYRAQLYNGINGTLVADFNPTRTTKGSTSLVASTGETWTVNGTAGAFIDGGNKGGFLPEPAATDLLLARTDARDQTTANWTLGATMARARTQTGWDGVANRATLFTAGAVAATNRCSMTFALAAANRTFSIGMKRGAGTGPVLITGDGFATTTDISAQLNTSTFTLVQIAANVLNPVIGWQVSTQNDTIITDWAQYSTGNLTGLINSRIPDTITTRNADVLSYSTTGWLNAAAGTLYAEWFNPALISPSDVASINDNSTNNIIRIYIDSGGTKTNAQVAVGGVTQSLLNTPVVATSAVAKAVNIYQLNDFAGYVNNSSLGTDAAGTIPTVTQFQIGHIAGISQLGHYIRKVSYYPPRLPNSVAQALTA